MTGQNKNNRPFKYLFFGLFLLLLITLVIPAGLSAQNGYQVKSIKFEGNTTLSDNLLLSQMSTYATTGFQRTILGKESYLFSENILQSDLSRIKRLYQQEGFLNVIVESSSHQINHDKQSIKITINISEGAPVIIKGILISIDSLSGDSVKVDSIDFENLLGELLATNGKRFRDSLIYEDQATILRLLENIGFPYANAKPELLVNEEANEVSIDWQITPELFCRFGEIKISGVKYVSESLVNDALTFKAGDIFSRAALVESQRRIYGLSLFHVVTVRAQLESKQDSIILVEIKIDEAPRLSSRIGIGYGREDRFRTYSDTHLLGFLGGARQLNLYLKHSYLEPYHVRLRFTQPAFLTSYTTLLVSPFILRQREPAFDQIRYGGLATLLHQLSNHLHGSATYSFERVDLDTSSLGDQVLDTTGRDDLYTKSGIKFGLTYDNSTPIFSPDHGFYAAGTFAVSGLGLGSDYHYTRILFDIRKYQQIFGMVLAGRVKTGSVESFDESGFIPVEDRFYAGGSSSVRGWPRAGLGPASDDGTPLGGNTLLEASMELRYPIYSRLSGALFFDAGNVWSESYSYHFDDLRYSAGLGLRVSTPIGPIRLDVAWPVADVDTKAQLHISVGEAF